MLSKVTIQNYKSLRNLEIPLRPLTVLVGPNNAGKSNLLDCFGFLQNLVEKREGAVSARGGFHRLVYNGDIKETIAINIDGTPISIPDVDYRYTLHLVSQDVTSFRITKETLFAKGRVLPLDNNTAIGSALIPDGRLLLEYPDKTESHQCSVYAPDGKRIGGGGQNPQQSYLNWWSNPEQYPVLGEFSQSVRNWGFYKIATRTIRKPVEIIKQLRINEDGSNIAAVLHIIRSEHYEAFKEIAENLKSVVPELDELRTEISEGAVGHTYIAIKEKSGNISIPAWNMSAGTLQLIGLLVILLNPSPPPLICIEEPEGHLHPGLMQEFAHIIRRASEKTQVIVSTHSPFLLNYLKPEDVLIVTKKDGATNVKEMAKTDGLKEALKVLGLGEVWFGNSDLGGATPVEG
ncbi:MAG: AAA family ATPase [Planctomycetes bacterium]|nr:AAA family ATPase [Planctomycetota bacterium]